MSFHPFNPRAVRFAFLGGAAACAAIVLWAGAAAARGFERYGEARAGVAAGLMFAFLFAFFRLRPRPGWGLSVEPLKVSLSRPLTTGAIELAPAEVLRLQRDPRGKQVALLLRNGQRILLARHLFASRRDFDEAVRALGDWKPEPSGDA